MTGASVRSKIRITEWTFGQQRNALENNLDSCGCGCG
jgi:hypothetical protein